MKNIYILLLFTALTFQSTFAQTKTTVYGNLGLENVNISIANTQYGTSTNAKGHYELPIYDRTEAVNLYYSCIGYQDTVVSLTPRQLQRDSINISFKMRKMSYDLQEVGVSAYSDFYRSPKLSNISDIDFAGDLVLVLENSKKQSALTLLDSEGNAMATTAFNGIYDYLYTDSFGNHILVGQDSCLQVYFDEKGTALPVSAFTNEQYREKIRKVVFEFGDGYLLRNTAYEKDDYFVKEFHGQAQTYSYVLKNDTLRQKQFLHRFIDWEAVEVCQSYLSEIYAAYHRAVPEVADEILLGVWNGNLLRLAEDPGLVQLIQWYCKIQAAEYHTTALKFDDFIQLIDLEKYEIVEVGKDFQVTGKRPLKVVSGEKYFKNQFLTDEATGKVYGLFVQNGIHYLGLYDPTTGTVGIGQQACREIYPRVFKVHGGYAYSVYFDKERLFGRINRMRINN